MSAVVDNTNLSQKRGTMNHSTIFSDIDRFHQADLLRQAPSQALLERAGITPLAQPKRLPAVAAFVVALILLLGTMPVQAAPGEHDRGSLAARQASAVSAPASCGTPHAVGVEGGLLSLLYDHGDSNPVAEIIRSRVNSLRTVRSGEATYLAYLSITC
jgi:hypothetical protein